MRRASLKRIIYTIFIIGLCHFVNTVVGQEISIGNGTEKGEMMPVNRYFNNSIWEGIYLKSEIGVAGYVQKLAFTKMLTDNGTDITNIKIYMKLNSAASLTSGSWSTAGYTLVFSGGIKNSSAAGIREIVLDQPFYFDNNQNLEIAIVNGPQPYAYDYPYWAYTTYSTTMSRAAANDASMPTTLTAMTGRPNVKLTMGCNQPVAYAGDEKVVCYESNGLQIGATVAATGGSGSYSYLWSPAAGLNNATLANPIANPAATTTYSLVVTDGEGCASRATQVVIHADNPSEEYLATGNHDYYLSKGSFYDNGGKTLGYVNNELSTITFHPCNAGEKLEFNFTQFDLENEANCQFDYLKIYNGASVSSPLIGTYCGTNSPGKIVSTSADGSLTFLFRSDWITNGAGFAATIGKKCDYTLNAGSDLSLCSDTLSVMIGGTSLVTGIQGETYAYQWTPETGLSNASISNPMVSPTVSTTYTLKVKDSKGCELTDKVAVDIVGANAEYNADVSKTLYVTGGTLNLSSANQTNVEKTIVVYPSESTKAIGVNFANFNLRSTQSWLKVYDGPNRLSTLRGTYNSTTIPSGDIYSTDESGALTFDILMKEDPSALGPTLVFSNKPQDPKDITINAGLDIEICNGTETFILPRSNINVEGYEYVLYNKNKEEEEEEVKGGYINVNSGSTSEIGIVVAPTTTTTYVLGLRKEYQTNYVATDEITITVLNPSPIQEIRGGAFNQITDLKVGADNCQWYANGESLEAAGRGYTIPYEYYISTYEAKKIIQMPEVIRSKGCVITADVYKTNGSCTLNSVYVNNHVTSKKEDPVILVSKNVNICQGEIAELVAYTDTDKRKGTPSFKWSTNEISEKINVSSITKTYTVTTTYNWNDISVVSTYNPCSGGSSTQTYTINTISSYVQTFVCNSRPKPIANITSDDDDLRICLGENIKLTAGGGGTYTWNDLQKQTLATIDISPDVTTTYTVTVSNAYCSSTTSATVNVMQLPEFTLNSDVLGNKICRGKIVQLSAHGERLVNYNWSNGLKTSTISVGPIVTTTYVVTATGANLCTKTESLTVEVMPDGSAECLCSVDVFPSSEISLCAGSEVILNLSGADVYKFEDESICAASTKCSTVVVNNSIFKSGETVKIFKYTNYRNGIINEKDEEIECGGGEITINKVSTDCDKKDEMPGMFFSNYGAKVYVGQGSELSIYGNFLNTGSISEVSDISEGSFDNKGKINVQLNWINESSSKVFHEIGSANKGGIVSLFGTNQELRGAMTEFNKLSLDGTGVIRMYCDESVVDKLYLNINELALKDNNLIIYNDDVNSILYNDQAAVFEIGAESGFISTDGAGSLTRKQKAGLDYIYPLGSSIGTYRFRPIALKSSVDEVCSLRFVNTVYPDIENTMFSNEVISINDKYYHELKKINAASKIDVKEYYINKEDGDYGSMARYLENNESKKLWQGVFNPTFHSPSSTDENSLLKDYVDIKSIGTSQNINEFVPFVIAKTGIYIDFTNVFTKTPTSRSGSTDPTDPVEPTDPGSSTGVTEAIITVTKYPEVPNPTPTGGDVTEGTGYVNPNINPGSLDEPMILDATHTVPTIGPVDASDYIIKINTGDNTVAGDIKYTITPNGNITDFKYIDADGLIKGDLSDDLIKVDPLHPGFVIDDVPANPFNNYVNDLSVNMGATGAFILVYSSRLEIAEDVIIKGLKKELIKSIIFKKGTTPIATIGSNSVFVNNADGVSCYLPGTEIKKAFEDNYTIATGASLAEGVASFELSIEQGAEVKVLRGQFIVKIIK